jgi:shikimate dehydrogenase
VLDGGGMAVFQAVDAFRLFTGCEPDAERMLAHFTSLVSTPDPGVRVG